MDFSQIKIHCSSLGHLYTEPKLKADKEAGKLSATAKTHLIKVYAKEYWGKEQELDTKEVKKGNFSEGAGIALLNKRDGGNRVKNKIRKSNEWISGECDVDEPDEVEDVKMSWNADTFLPKLTEPIDRLYWTQLQGYMWLYNKPFGKLSYCLVSTPEELIIEEEMWLLKRMNVLSEESPEYIKAAEKLRFNMTFDEIPINERIISHVVHRDNDFIATIPGVVTKARQFLQEFHELHTKSKQMTTINV